MLGSSLNRGNSGVSEETSTKTKKNLGTDNTTNLTSIVSTSESDKKTKSDSVGERSENDECFESSNLHND